MFVYLVAVRHAGSLTQKQSTEMLHLLQGFSGILRQDLDVLGCIFIGKLVGFVQRFNHRDLPVCIPGRACQPCRRKVKQQLVDMLNRLAAYLFRIGDQNRRRIWTVLCLRQQICGDRVRIRVLIRDNQNFRRAREEIYADLSEQLSFAFSHKGIPGAGNEVNFPYRLCTNSHSYNSLYTTENEYLIGSRQMHCGNGRIRNLTIDRWRATDYVLDTGHFCGEDGHVS